MNNINLGAVLDEDQRRRQQRRYLSMNRDAAKKSMQFIKGLKFKRKVQLFDEENMTEPCPVCLESMEEGYICRTVCSHTFHLLCIQCWTRKSPTCPMCREQL